MATALTACKSSLRELQGFPGADFPVPLFVRNTFIDYDVRQPELDEFVHDRQTRSCPSSPASRPMCETEEEIDNEDRSMALSSSWPSYVAPWKQVSCTRLSKRCCGDDCEHEFVRRHRSTKSEAPGIDAIDQETWSDCSTIDTLERGQPTRERETPSDASLDACSVPIELQLDMSTKFMTSTYPAFPVAQFPSMGSIGHYEGNCKPCAFLSKRGCSLGLECDFCHLCDAGEKKRRQKEKRAYFNKMKINFSTGCSA